MIDYFNLFIVRTVIYGIIMIYMILLHTIFEKNSGNPENLDKILVLTFTPYKATKQS